jgi:hypothetical protein
MHVAATLQKVRDVAGRTFLPLPCTISSHTAPGRACAVTQISDEYDVAVIVTNQITDKPLSDAGLESLSPAEANACLHSSSGGRHSWSVPALGLGWSLGVNTRLMLTRREAAGPRWDALASTALHGHQPHHADTEFQQWQQQPVSHFVRQLHVMFSPRMEYRWCPFEVCNDGIVGSAG